MFKFNSGARYEGEYRNGKRNGKGTYYYANGDKYVGDYVNGDFEGQGKYYFKDGDWFEGEFRNDKRNGKGVYHFADGSWEEGNYVDGECVKVIKTSSSSTANGSTSSVSTGGSTSSNNQKVITATNSAGTYTGTFDKDGKPSGKGVFKFNGGDSYEGYFLHGKRNGYGIYQYQSGEKYIGNFLDNCIHGFGRYYFGNGDWFEGEHRNRKRNGYGVYHFANGRWNFSLYKDGGEKDGGEVRILLSFDDIYRALGSSSARKLTYSDGEYFGEVTKNYNGDYVSDGFGRYKTKGGIVIEGQFENGDNNGYVRINFGNGIYIYGERRNGSFCGDVFEIYSDGAYVGKISDDFHHYGKNCTVYRSDGSWYNCVDSNLSGYGTMYLAKGGWIRGLFENGKPVRIDEKYE